jgi:hypothetical protein
MLFRCAVSPRPGCALRAPRPNGRRLHLAAIIGMMLVRFLDLKVPHTELAAKVIGTSNPAH